MTNLFRQLGLDADEQAIADFIHTHQLEADARMTEAPFWNEAQRQFLREQLQADNHWSTVVDQLGESLHEDAVKASAGRLTGNPAFQQHDK
jgi:hypothetical protein